MTLQHTFKQLGAAGLLMLAVGCGAQSAPTSAGTTGATTVAQAVTATPGDFVLLYNLNGLPTTTPTPNPTDQALWATINAGTPSLTPTTPHTTALGGTASAASSNGNSNTTDPMAGMPGMGGTAAAASTGDPKKGETFFTGVAGCSSCHDVKNGITIVGPSLKGVASRAGTRKPGMSADAYLHESIVSPNAFVVSGFPSGVMPQSFAQTLSKQQIDDIVAYLETLK